MTNNTICSRCKCKNEDGLGVMKNGKNYKTCVNCRTKRKNYYRNGIYNTETEEVSPGISDSDTICSIITNCPIAFGETCPICLDNCGSSSIKLDCGHPICVECFENILCSKHAKILELTEDINCPICRKLYMVNTYHNGENHVINYEIVPVLVKIYFSFNCFSIPFIDAILEIVEEIGRITDRMRTKIEIVRKLVASSTSPNPLDFYVYKDGNPYDISNVLDINKELYIMYNVENVSLSRKGER